MSCQELQAFLAASQALTFSGQDRSETYGWIEVTGFVDIRELGWITAYPKAVIHAEHSLPAIAVYADVYATGNPAGPAL